MVSSLLLYITLFVSLFVEVFLLITYFEIREELKFEKTHPLETLSHHPSVTIIVPCYNEEATVCATVNSLLALDYPQELLRLMIVDDGSTDGTQKVLEIYKNNPQIQTFKKANGGKHTALNFALEKIESDLVGCLDADSFVDPQALRHIVRYFDDVETMAVTPAVRVHEPQTVIQHMQKVEYTWGVLWRRILASINGLYVTPGPFSIFRTKVFKKIGNYRYAHHTEDLELALRLQKNGYKIANAFNANVYTVSPNRLKDLLKQRVRWSYGFLNNAFDYREMFFNKKFGSIGIFVLPIATFSIFTTLYSASRVLYSIFSRIADALTKYQAVGLADTFHAPHVSLSWFYLNTSIGSILATCAIVLSLTILSLSIYLSEGKLKMSRGLFYYLTIYAFIVPLWLAKATYSTLTRTSITWR